MIAHDAFVTNKTDFMMEYLREWIRNARSIKVKGLAQFSRIKPVEDWNNLHDLAIEHAEDIVGMQGTSVKLHFEALQQYDTVLEKWFYDMFHTLHINRV